MEGKRVLGAVEQVTIVAPHGKKTVQARIDTGAVVSSIDSALAIELGLNPEILSKKIRSAHGTTERPVVNVTLIIAGNEISGEATIIGRTHMSYPLLIGRNILKMGFTVDVSR